MLLVTVQYTVQLSAATPAISALEKAKEAARLKSTYCSRMYCSTAFSIPKTRPFSLAEEKRQERTFQADSLRPLSTAADMTTFITKVDNFANPYFSLDLQGNANHVNVTEISLAQGGNIGSFFDVSIPVSGRFDGPFSSDLTTRDDVLLAFLSLILLLLIEAITTTILLRSKEGNVTTLGFSVKQIVELIRDFKMRRIFTARMEREPKKGVNIKLLSIAISILALTFGLEVAVLFVTSTEFSIVTNSMATLRIRQPVTPNWSAARFHNRVSINRPCAAISLSGVEQGQTRINMCVTSTVNSDKLNLFSKASGEVQLELLSYMHEYGAEHSLRIDDVTATYSTRAYFTLGDKKSRLMRHASKSEKEEGQMKIVHLQFLAYLFSAYLRATEDETMNLKRLNLLEPLFGSFDGPDIQVLELQNEVRVKSTKYSTTLKGAVPRGLPALRFAQHFFRGTAAVIVAGPSEEDLFVEEGLSSSNTVVWRESTRAVNWLSLCIILLATTLLLIVLRMYLHPVSAAEIAAAFVKTKVGADLHRSPVQLGKEEMTYFRLEAAVDDDYTFGAETNYSRSRRSDDYRRHEYVSSEFRIRSLEGPVELPTVNIH